MVAIRLADGRRRIDRRLPTAVLVVVLLVLAASCSQKSEADLANEALAQGLAAHEAGRLAEAEADYREVLVHDPNNKYAYYNLGLIDQTNGALASAESNYRLSLSIDPGFPPALFNLAIVRHDLGDLKESIDLYRQDIKLERDNASAHLNLGFALIEAHQKQQGLDELNIAVQLNPDFADRVKAVKVEPSPKPGESPSTSDTMSPSA